MLSGPALIEDIQRTEAPRGACAFWWLGQHSFVVKMGAAVLYLDPFLTASPGRRIPPLLHPAEVTNATLFFGSHDHLDHIDRAAWPQLAQAAPNARFVVPQAVLDAGLANQLEIPQTRFLGLDAEGTIEVNDLRITALASAHEFFDCDARTGRYPYLGFVIEGNDCRIYHPGDTVKYEGLETRLKKFERIDVAFLPINGRDAARYKAGVIGNMTFQEAADLAGAVHPRLTVPTHYDMFDGNLEDVSKFTDYMAVKYPRLRTHVCGYGLRTFSQNLI